MAGVVRTVWYHDVLCGTLVCGTVWHCVVCGTVWHYVVPWWVRTAYKKELDIEKKLMFRVERLEGCV